MENQRNIVYTTTSAAAAAPATITITTTTTYHNTAMFCPHTVSNLFIHYLFIHFALIIFFVFCVFQSVKEYFIWNAIWGHSPHLSVMF